MAATQSTWILLVLTTACCVLPPALSAEKCNPQDKAALLRIKNEFGNPPYLSSWVSTTDCCGGTWQGVSCDTDNQTFRVNNIDIFGFSLLKPTPIPPSIGDLPYLFYLSLTNIKNLAGPIPTAIAKLTSLRYLYISQTNISGTIPDFLSTIKSLVTIDFSDNQLSGPLPPSLSSLPNLVGVTLGDNSLSGPIPDSYGSLSSQFTSLTAPRNRLSGTIPASLKALNLAFVDLSGNMLEGDASVLFGADKNTQKIILAKNKLAFDFGKVGLSSDLNTIDVRNNNIFGKLPEGLTQLKSLHKLNVSYNDLCGSIPQGGNLQRFDQYAYSHNDCLCGAPLTNPCKCLCKKSLL